MKTQFVCLLLVLLSVTVLSRDAEDIEDIKDIKARYKKFKKKHIYEKDKSTFKSCDVMMKKNTKKCKDINTFILAKEEEVKSICKGKTDEMITSKRKFDLIVCKRKGYRAKVPKCNYTMLKKNKRIKIKCVDNYPVHYEDDMVTN